jgi:hypothetical protein
MSAAAVGSRLVRIFLLSLADQLPGSCDREIAREDRGPWSRTERILYPRRASLLASSGGGPLTNREGHSREIGVAEGVHALGLDCLRSSAYGPEAALSILAAAGAAGLAELGPVMLVS